MIKKILILISFLSIVIGIYLIMSTMFLIYNPSSPIEIHNDKYDFNNDSYNKYPEIIGNKTGIYKLINNSTTYVKISSRRI